jgi:hypothetical protein
MEILDMIMVGFLMFVAFGGLWFFIKFNKEN